MCECLVGVSVVVVSYSVDLGDGISIAIGSTQEVRTYTK